MATITGARHPLLARIDEGDAWARATYLPLARELGELLHPDRLRGTYRRAVELRDAAEAAAPMIAAALAVSVHAGAIDWDTGETVQAAAWRLALDAAWALVDGFNPVFPRARDIFAGVLDALGYVDRPAAEYARVYLDRRDEIDAALAERGIRFGGRLLAAQDAADRVRVAGGTWRAYVSRGEAPAADEGGRWRYATVDAWRLTRPRVATPGW